MSSKGFGRSFLGSLVAVVVLAAVVLGAMIVQVFEYAIAVPGAEAFRPAEGAWSAVPEPAPAVEPLPPAQPVAPGDMMNVMVFADGSAVALPIVPYAEPKPTPTVHWYDGRQWRRIADLERPFEWPAAVRLADGRIVIGDRDASFVLDPARGTLAPTGVPLGGEWAGLLVAAGDRAYAVIDAMTHHRIAVLVPDEGAWTPLPNSLSPRAGALIRGLPDGTLLIVGGMKEGRRVRTEGALSMAGLVILAGLVVFLSTRAIRGGVHWGGTLAGAVLGVAVALVGWFFLIALSATAHGRPLRLDRRVWRGRVRAGAEHRARSSLPWPARRILARAWARDAALEHASVAAFEQLARRLEVVGAPAELVARARRAAAEEAEHTRLCLALAERYAGRTLALAPTPALPQPPVLAGPARTALLEQLAIESLVDGTLGEGWAAAAAAQALQEATDPEVRRALEVIARDEASHAAHARDVVAFCVAEGGEPVREAVRRATTRARRRIRHRGLPVRRWTDALAQHGRFREARPGALDARLRARP